MNNPPEWSGPGRGDMMLARFERRQRVSECDPCARALRQLVADRALDLAGSLYGRPRHQVVMGRGAPRLVGRFFFQGAVKAQVEPEQVDTSDRVGPAPPAAPAEPTLGQNKTLLPALDAPPPRRMDSRCDERHPGDHLGFC